VEEVPVMPGTVPLRLTLTSRLDELEPARRQVDAFLAPLDLAERTRYAVELVLEEAFMNVVMHAHGDRGVHPVGLSVHVGAESIVLAMEDDGRPFDPLPQRLRPVPTSLAEAAPGGLGLHFLRRYARALDYRRIDGRNRLSITIARTP
jgi:serine/threonine-protein kinase RsbW